MFYQEAGGTLIVNGPISNTNTVQLSLKGAGTIQLNGLNTYTGGTILAQAGTALVVGNDSALGGGALNINNSAILQAGGGTRTLSNVVVLGADTTISGSNALNLNGSVTSSGALTRTLTVNNTATTTIGGSLFLSELSSTGRTLSIGGTGSVVINGVVSNFNGAGTAGVLRYSGIGTLTLNNSNTHSGGTQITIANGTIIANHDGALGTGNVSLLAATVTLTLQNGATNNYIADNANLNIGFTNDVVNLSYSGTDTIGSLTVNGVQQNPGIYGSSTSGAANVLPELFGTGTLTVVSIIPEPATYMLIGLGALVCAQQFRRKKT